MAANSRREQIMLALVALLEDISSIKQVKRKQPSDIAELKRYSSQQMPLAVVIGGVPQPEEHISGRSAGGVDIVKSVLEVDIYVYFMDNSTPDQTLSSLLDDIWSAVYASQTLGKKFVDGMRLKPRKELAVWEPYVAFGIQAMIHYYHKTGGI